MTDDPYGSFDDMAGMDGGDSVSEGSDRGDGEWGEFDYLGDLGNAGGSPLRAQASSFDSRVMAAEGTALSGTSEGSRPPASGKGDLGAVSLRPCSEWPGRSTLLGRPPAHPGEFSQNDLRYVDPSSDPTVNSWSRGPPPASPSFDELAERYMYRASEGARGTRNVDNAIAGVVRSACGSSSSADHEAPLTTSNTRGGATSLEDAPREGASRSTQDPAACSTEDASHSLRSAQEGSAPSYTRTGPDARPKHRPNDDVRSDTRPCDYARPGDHARPVNQRRARAPADDYQPQPVRSCDCERHASLPPPL